MNAYDYYPFGMVIPERRYAGNGYRFGFNGKESDNEVKGAGNQQDYGMRIYEPRYGRFLSVDPLFKSYPWNSSYAFAENDVIRSIDLDGLEKLQVVTTSFAPFDIFASDFFGGYYGDGENRKFGDAPFSLSGDIGKYRTMGYVSFDMSSVGKPLSAQAGATSSTYHRPAWNPLPDYKAISPTHIEFEGSPTFSLNANSLSFQFHTYGSDQAVAGASSNLSPVPNIDNHVSLSITKVGATKLNVSGYVTGDRYPSNETYLRDEKGGTIILGVSGPNAGKEGPYLSLWGDRRQPMSFFAFDILLNDDNSFKGVQINNKFFTAEEWNKQFSNLSSKQSQGTVSVGSDTSVKPFDDEEE
jgi:RHS repeat-associated protein